MSDDLSERGGPVFQRPPSSGDPAGDASAEVSGATAPDAITVAPVESGWQFPTLQKLDSLSSIGGFLVTLLLLALAALKRRELWWWLKRRLGVRPPSPERDRPKRQVIGREAEVGRLREILGSGRTAVIVPEGRIVGGGGYGKTTLALHYLRRSFGEGSDGTYGRYVPPIPSSSRERIEAGLAEFARTHVPGCEGRLTHEQAQAALGYLQRESVAQRWLVIFDNVEDPAHLQGLVPSGARLHVIVTSRHREWTEDGFGVLPLGALAEDDAVALLCQEAGRPEAVGDEEARKLAADLEGLPLGLVQAGEVCRQRGLGFAEYRRQLGQLIHEFPDAGTERGDYPRSLGAALRLALKGVTRDERRLLNVLAFLDPESAGPEVFADIAKKPWVARFAPMYRVAPWSLWRFVRSPERLARVYAGLEGRDLLEPKDGALTIHRVTQRVIRT